MRLYHGTTSVHRQRILHRGLQPRGEGRVPLFLTADEQRAAGYAARAVCVELHRRGLHHLKFAKPALVLVLGVPDDLLIADPAEPGDYAVDGSIPAAWITRSYEFDARRWLRPGDVRRYGKLAGMARAVETDWNQARMGAPAHRYRTSEADEG